MFRAWYELSNSVNDDEVNVSRFFITEELAQAFIDKKLAEVDEWNKSEVSPHGGKMSTRYIYSGVEEVTPDTPLEGITFGDLESIIIEIIRKETR